MWQGKSTASEHSASTSGAPAELGFTDPHRSTSSDLLLLAQRFLHQLPETLPRYFARSRIVLYLDRPHRLFPGTERRFSRNGQRITPLRENAAQFYPELSISRSGAVTDGKRAKNVWGVMSTTTAGVPKSDWTLPSRPGLQIEDVSGKRRDRRPSVLRGGMSLECCCTCKSGQRTADILRAPSNIRALHSHCHIYGVIKNSLARRYPLLRMASAGSSPKQN